MNITQVLEKIRPEARWKLTDNKYDNLEWFDEEQEKPTEQEIIDAWPDTEDAIKWENIRSRRDMLLGSTDRTQLFDIDPLVSEKFKPYRQALRDIPQDYANVDDVVWPTPPE